MKNINEHFCEKCLSLMEQGPLTFCPDGMIGCEAMHHGFECKKCVSEQLDKNLLKLNRENEIRSEIRKVLIDYLKTARTSLDTIFKEVWEKCSPTEYGVINDEIIRIVYIIINNSSKDNLNSE